MARIDDLLKRIRSDMTDEESQSLRSNLEDAIKDLRETKSFGLVYEKHIPETALINLSPRKGSQVIKRTDPKSPIYEVQDIQGDVAILKSLSNSQDDIQVSDNNSSKKASKAKDVSKVDASKVKNEKEPLENLFVVKSLQDPVWVGLSHLDSVRGQGPGQGPVVASSKNNGGGGVPQKPTPRLNPNLI